MLAHVARNRLSGDDRVVNDDEQRRDEPSENDGVGRLVEHVEHEPCRHDGERNGDGADYHAAPAEEERTEREQNERGGDDQRDGHDDVLSALGVPIDDGGTGGTPGDTTPPAAPTSLTATDGQFQVQLDWDDNTEPDFGSYTVYRSTTAGGPYTPIVGSLTTSAYTDTTALNNVTHYYVVTARDESGNESTDSNEASATPLDDPPATPTGLAATPGDRQIALDWDDNTEPDFTGYRIYRTTTSGSGYTLIASNWTTSQFTDTGLTNGLTYHYTVTAQDTSSNESTPTPEASATLVPPGSSPPYLQSGVVTATTDGWTTVTLDHDYGANLVVVTTPNYDSSTAALVARVQNASGSSFEVRLATTNGAGSIAAPVHWFAVEAGVYTAAEHGITMETHTFTSTVTDRRGSWAAQVRSYSQTYASPVVVGQVMTANDPAWSVFWARGGSRGAPPSASTLRVGKHVAEDPNTARDGERNHTTEQVSYIALG